MKKKSSTNNRKKVDRIEYAKDVVQKCRVAAENKKALNIQTVEVHEFTDLTDYFLVCSGTSETQVKAIADGIKQNLKKDGVECLGVEGYHHGQWILLDFGEVIVHIFNDYVRDIYDLEGLWKKPSE